MSGAIPPLPQYAFIAWCLDKHRDNFTLTLCVASQRVIVVVFLCRYRLIPETFVYTLVLVSIVNAAHYHVGYPLHIVSLKAVCPKVTMLSQWLLKYLYISVGSK
jgi:hypothetical protein